MDHYAIHWFRRDLRIPGNLALKTAADRTQGKVLGLFFFDSKFLAREDFSHNRFAFFLNTLEALRSDLRAQGGELLVLDRGPRQGFEEVLKFLKEKKALPSLITFSRDYEPYARVRDEEIDNYLTREWKVDVHTERDHLILEPWEIQKDKGFYQIYTPFSKKWFATLGEEDHVQRIKNAFTKSKHSFTAPTCTSLISEKFRDKLSEYKKENEKKVTVEIPRAGHAEATRILRDFSKKIDAYKIARDFPADLGTSGFSIFLKNGSLTTAQIMNRLGHTVTVFNKQLVWREFFYHILHHCPRVEKESFNVRYKNIEWKNDKKEFEAWKNGLTGFPIVDAGMRELKTTGRMHNRVRMIVSSFLTKDLLIDWRWGEQYFMKELLDGDLAPNNGGWQWAASTGCDPQPYFRIFNPELQSRKFDAKGEYIRRHVPELAKLSNKEIHAPQDAVRPKNYPAPIVDHSKVRLTTLAAYKKVR